MNLLTLSSHELLSVHNTSGYFLHVSLCPAPSLSNRAYIDDEGVVIDDAAVGYHKGTFSIVCNEKYRYDSGTLECDPSLIYENSPWVGDIGNCILIENCFLLLTLLSTVLCLYWGIFWLLSWKAYRQTRKETMHHDMHNFIDLHPPPLSLSSDRSIKIERGCMGELFGGEKCSPFVLVPDLHGNVRRSSLRKYILDMSYAFRFTLTLNVADFITDLLFAQNMYYTHPCIAIISGASFMFSSVGFVLCLLVDYKAFQREISQEDRSLVRLRWEILILTPLEDIIHGILGIYLFVHDIVDFITFLCIAFSGGMVIARIFKLVIADQGGMNTTKRLSGVELPPMVSPGYDHDAEDSITNESHSLGETIATKIEQESTRGEGETIEGEDTKRVVSSEVDCDDHLEEGDAAGGVIPEESFEIKSHTLGETIGLKDDQKALKEENMSAE